MRITRFKPCREHPEQDDCWCGAQYDALTRDGMPIKLEPRVLGDDDTAMMAFVLVGRIWYGQLSSWYPEVLPRVMQELTLRVRL